MTGREDLIVAAPSITQRALWRGVFAAMAGIAAFSVSSTLTIPLLSLLMEREGVSDGDIGINTAAAALATLLFAPLAPAVMRRIGLPWFIAACLIASIAALIGFKVWWDYYWWAALRLVLGAATGGLFVATEYWISAASPDAIRGRVVAVYAITLAGGYAVGPSILAVVGTEGWPPFLAAIALCAIALGPLALAWSDAPTVEQRAAPGAVRFFWTAPSLLWAAVLFGVFEYSTLAFIPVWGLALPALGGETAGMTESAAIALTVVLSVGGLLFQPFLGFAADRMSDRPLLLACAATVTVGALALPTIIGSYAAIASVLFVWGGMAAGLYTISLTALGRRYRGADLASANAAMVMAYGLGALVGPPIVGFAMQAFEISGFPISIGVLSLIYCGLVIGRLELKDRRAT